MSVQTVLGPVPVSTLGHTLTHEHLSLNFEHFYVPPQKSIDKFIGDRVSLQNAGWVRQYPYSNRDNLNIRDAEALQAVARDVEIFKELGGGTIVENSSHGLFEGYEFLYNLSKKTGVNIVAGTGFYVTKVQKPEVVALNQEKMYEIIVNDLEKGAKVGDVDVKCGFIGEVGSDWPISDFERNAIRATAQAQESLKVGVSFHPGRTLDAPFEIVRLYLEAGGDKNKCVMSHLDRTLLNDREKFFEFTDLGVYNQFDLFGVECSLYQFNQPYDMPSDGQRLNRVVEMVQEGLRERIMVSHDIHTKHRLTAFGGHGYHHLLVNVLPRLLIKGLTQDDIDQISVRNPANWLAVGK